MDVVLYNEIYLYAFILLHYKGYTMVELYIFQKLNMSELLKIFIDFDLLEDGVILTMEYIDAVMDSFTGQESTKFSLKVYYYFYATVNNRRCDAHKQCLLDSYSLTMNFVRIQRCFFFYMPFSDFCAILNGPTPYNSIWLLNKIVE